MFKSKTTGILLLALVLPGCMNGDRKVEIRADRPVGVFEGARALASGVVASPTLQADAPHTLTIRAEGCAPKTVTFTPRTSGSRVAMFVVSCVLFPLALLRLPFALASGEFCDLDPESVVVEMGGAR